MRSCDSLYSSMNVPGQLDDFFSNRKRCGQSRRLDSIERDDPRTSVLERTVQEEVALGFSGSHNFRADSGVARRELSILEVGPVAAYGSIKTLRTFLGH